MAQTKNSSSKQSSLSISGLSFDGPLITQIVSKFPVEIATGEIDQLTHIFQKTIDQQLNCILTFNGFFDEKRMKKAVFLSYFIDPILGSRFVIRGKNAVWVRRDDFVEKISCDFIPITISPREQIFSFVTSPINPQIDLPLRIVFFRTKTHDILCLKASHEALDGAAVKEYLTTLATLYSRLKTEPHFLPRPKKITDRSLKQIFRNLNLLQKLNVLLHLRAGKPVVSLPGKVESTKKRNYEILSFTKEQFRKMKAFCKNFQVSITTFLITAFHRALTCFVKFQPGERVLSTITVNLRSLLPKYSTNNNPLCNLTSSANIYSKHRPDESFEETLQQIVKAMKKRKKAGIGLGSALFCHLLFKGGYQKAEKILEKKIQEQKKMGTTFPIITNLGFANPSDFSFGDVTMHDALIIPPFVKTPAFMMGVLTFNEKMSLSIAYFEESYEPSQIKAFLMQMKNEMLSALNKTSKSLLKVDLSM